MPFPALPVVDLAHLIVPPTTTEKAKTLVKLYTLMHQAPEWAPIFTVPSEAIRIALDTYTKADLVGQWARSIVGIDAVIAATLLAFIDVEPWHCREPHSPHRCGPEAPHASHCRHERIESPCPIWRFAGLEDDARGHPELARVMRQVGARFMSLMGQPESVYATWMAARRTLECHRTDEQLELWGVKLFLAHYHQVAYRHRFGELPRGKPPAVPVPNWPFEAREIP